MLGCNVFPWRQQAWRQQRKRCLWAMTTPVVVVIMVMAVVGCSMLSVPASRYTQQLAQQQQQYQALQKQVRVGQQRWQTLQCDVSQLQQIAHWWRQVAMTLPASLQLQSWSAEQQRLNLSVRYQRVSALQQWTQVLEQSTGVAAVHWHEMKQQKALHLATVVVTLTAGSCHEAT